MSDLSSSNKSKNTQSAKLPKHVMRMVEKNNFVSAIKTLANEENISMDEAKTRIDAYEEAIKQKRQAEQEKIAQKQHKQEQKKQYTQATLNNSNTSSDTIKHSNNKLDDSLSNPLTNLEAGLNQHLSKQGYKKPLVPYWVWRVLIIVAILIIIGGGIYYTICYVL